MFDILKYMDKTTVMKIPVEILETIKSKIDFNYKTNVNPNDLFNEKNISKEGRFCGRRFQENNTSC